MDSGQGMRMRVKGIAYPTIFRIIELKRCRVLELSTLFLAINTLVRLPTSHRGLLCIRMTGKRGRMHLREPELILALVRCT